MQMQTICVWTEIQGAEMKRILIFCLAILTVLIPVLTASCEGQEDDRPVIAVTIAPEAEFVKKITGDKFNVITLVPPGYNPESYAIDIQQSVYFSRAELYFSIGVPSETGVAVPSNVKEIKLHEEVGKTFPHRMFDEDRDPHIWLSVSRVKAIVNLMADEIAAKDMENAEFYRANAAKYLSELDAANAQIQGMFERLTMKKFLVFHPAYGYFADEYGLEMIALEEEGHETTAAHKAEIIDYARANGINAIFYQSDISAAEPESVAEELNGEAVLLNPLAENYIENLMLMANLIRNAMR